MSVQSEITRISGNVTAALAAIADKGVTVPDGSTSDALAPLIASIEAGGGGNVKLAIGTITPAEDKNYIEIEHGLGVVPNIAFLICDTDAFRANTYAACYKKDSHGISVLRTGSNANQIMLQIKEYEITGVTPTSALMDAYAIAAYAATEKTIRFGNENLTSVTVNIKACKHQWLVGRVDS